MAPAHRPILTPYMPNELATGAFVAAAADENGDASGDLYSAGTTFGYPLLLDSRPARSPSPEGATALRAVTAVDRRGGVRVPQPGRQPRGQSPRGRGAERRVERAGANRAPSPGGPATLLQDWFGQGASPPARTAAMQPLGPRQLRAGSPRADPLRGFRWGGHGPRAGRAAARARSPSPMDGRRPRRDSMFTPDRSPRRAGSPPSRMPRDLVSRLRRTEGANVRRRVSPGAGEARGDRSSRDAHMRSSTSPSPMSSSVSPGYAGVARALRSAGATGPPGMTSCSDDDFRSPRGEDAWMHVEPAAASQNEELEPFEDVAGPSGGGAAAVVSEPGSPFPDWDASNMPAAEHGTAAAAPAPPPTSGMAGRRLPDYLLLPFQRQQGSAAQPPQPPEQPPPSAPPSLTASSAPHSSSLPAAQAQAQAQAQALSSGSAAAATGSSANTSSADASGSARVNAAPSTSALLQSPVTATHIDRLHIGSPAQHSVPVQRGPRRAAQDDAHSQHERGNNKPSRPGNRYNLSPNPPSSRRSLRFHDPNPRRKSPRLAAAGLLGPQAGGASVSEPAAAAPGASAPTSSAQRASQATTPARSPAVAARSQSKIPTRSMPQGAQVSAPMPSPSRRRSNRLRAGAEGGDAAAAGAFGDSDEPFAGAAGVRGITPARTRALRASLRESLGDAADDPRTRFQLRMMCENLLAARRDRRAQPARQAPAAADASDAAAAAPAEEASQAAPAQDAGAKAVQVAVGAADGPEQQELVDQEGGAELVAGDIAGAQAVATPRSAAAKQQGTNEPLSPPPPGMSLRIVELPRCAANHRTELIAQVRATACKHAAPLVSPE